MMTSRRTHIIMILIYTYSYDVRAEIVFEKPPNITTRVSAASNDDDVRKSRDLFLKFSSVRNFSVESRIIIINI